MTAGPTDNVRCAIRNDNNDLNNNNGFRVCASHASLMISNARRCPEFIEGLILRYNFRRKCSASTDASRGKTGEIARSSPGCAFSTFINGR
jgi:hypothetical protein